tara:strand:- start:103 stop:342 length:240 start_codon:yes stop_codon:yes gene_type:complete
MTTIKTQEDGWDCNTDVLDLASLLEDLDHLRYEINNCVRQASVEEIVDAFSAIAHDLLRTANSIDTNVKYETVYPPDED